MREFEAEKWRIRDHDAYYPTLSQQLHRLDTAKSLSSITKVVVRVAIDLAFVKTATSSVVLLYSRTLVDEFQKMYFVMLTSACSGATPRESGVEHGEFADAWVKCVSYHWSWSCMHTLGDQLLVALNSQVVS